MAKNDYRNILIQDPKFALEAVKGDFIMDVTESICEILENEEIDRKDLANKMNKTKGYISQLLNGDRNMTLATLAEILYSLNYKPVIKFENQNKNTVYKGKVESNDPPLTNYHLRRVKVNLKKAA